MLTRQEIFDKAWLGLKGQGFRKSYSRPQGCMYRGPNGLRCAIGHCISDEDYSPKIEGLGADSASVTEIIGEEISEFAADLQCCHDFSRSPEDMEMRLRDFAALHSLTIPAA